MATRGRPPGQPKSGGRQVGAKNKVQITEQMRNDILTVYAAMGGVKFLLDWATNNQTEYVRQCLSRLMPAPSRDEEQSTHTVVNVNDISDLEVARRIAFALTKGAHI